MERAILDSIIALIRAYEIEIKSDDKMEMRSNNHIAFYLGNEGLKKNSSEHPLVERRTTLCLLDLYSHLPG